ncbi:MalY/PatB family protein [Streptomyces sp. ST2-7A]|uniref:MalY/PatB family protein n=1 Tax=Streptomyces sp. ST2-7A TaxID=2907214 RepID=UPI001F2EC93F|nr:aminotransferase class I/II-fold pyridoxal phosphate-dependent enzyme [Streptomyces sp. ST2-7A]MCE7079674.1 aminotransferase class I/II-fold pyridoxal phosphate-dependent enzyme [Streptomyces sp. ST2-7A]
MAEAEAAAPDGPLVALGEEHLRRRTSAKWRFHPADVLPLWVAEADVPTPEPVARALREAIDLGDLGYPADHLGYVGALDAFSRERWGVPVPEERTVPVGDVIQGITELVALLTPPDGTVVISPPLYPPIAVMARHRGRRVVEAPLDPAGRLDPEALERAFRTAPGSVYVLCNPHNPTGTVPRADELDTLAGLAGRYGVRVVADEIHAPIVPPGARFTPWLSRPGSERGFSVFSASKSWNLPGVKAALVVAGPEAGRDLAALPIHLGDAASHLGVLAHTVALREGGAWLDGFLAGIAANRRLLTRLLDLLLPGVGLREPEGTYLAWPDFRERWPDEPDPAARLLERGRVALSPGPDFGTGGEGRARINLACSPAVLAEAVRRMAAAD